MSIYHCFTNPGEIDPRLITLMGTNVKTSASAIGQFGTGLKYAIAGVLRLGGTIVIHSGLSTINFVTVPTVIRDKDFTCISMEIDTYPKEETERQILGFTTDLGSCWEPWMLYRELLCNARDEGGEISGPGNVGLPIPGQTTIYVALEAFDLVQAETTKYFLDTVPLWANAELEIHPARDDNAIFYHGIRVAEAKTAPTIFTYNILATTALTEDRTLDRWTCAYYITNALAKLDDKAMAETVLLASHGRFEATLNFNYLDALSPTMREATKLLQYNASLNATVRSRSRYLYPDDYRPVAIPMTVEQTAKAIYVVGLINQFNFVCSWTNIRTADLSSSGNETVVDGGICWIDASVMDSPEWLLYLLKEVDGGTFDQFNGFEGTLNLVKAMGKALPDDILLGAILAEHAPPVEEPSPFSPVTPAPDNSTPAFAKTPF